MSFAKLPGQAPPFDASAMLKFINTIAAKIYFGAPAKQLPLDFVAWKRWMEASNEYDGTGLRDVVAANAQALNAVKADLDRNGSEITVLEAKVAALENRPPNPFPFNTTGASG